jgi:hypothetical protein
MLKATVLLLLMMAATPIAPAALANSAANVLSNHTCQTVNQAGDNLSGCTTNEVGLEKHGGLATQIVNTILYAAGVVALVFILVSGFRYITATGDSTRIQAAKETLLYAIIGLIITILAVPIADFVIAHVTGA